MPLAAQQKRLEPNGASYRRNKRRKSAHEICTSGKGYLCLFRGEGGEGLKIRRKGTRVGLGMRSKKEGARSIACTGYTTPGLG